jgi:demethylmenaquinone methyltransferase/2-methoxy-6-polyprenyl-1,4-benzoquinol methylase
MRGLDASARAQGGLTDEERAYYSLNERVYRVFAPLYDLVVLPARGLRRKVVRLADLPPDSRVLDVATGTGAQAFAFATVAKEVVGVDLSEAMLRIAGWKNSFSNLTFKHGDATNLPFEATSFDATCISFALHEMPNSVRERVLREMARVTRPGGRALVVDYGLPRGGVTSSIVYQVVKLYEPDPYVSFVKLDLEALLGRAGIVSVQRHSLLGGIVNVFAGERAEGG